MFHNSWLLVDKAIEPSLIMWENLGYNKQQRNMRIVCTTLTAGILLTLTVFIVLVIRTQKSSLADFAPEINCKEQQNLTQELAFKDQLLPLEEREGFMSCYCR